MENRKSHTPVALRKQIGGTMYVVRVHFNEDAEESMKDKIKRLIENDVRANQHTAYGIGRKAYGKLAYIVV